MIRKKYHEALLFVSICSFDLTVLIKYHTIIMAVIKLKIRIAGLSKISSQFHNMTGKKYGTIIDIV